MCLCVWLRNSELIFFVELWRRPEWARNVPAAAACMPRGYKFRRNATKLLTYKMCGAAARAYPRSSFKWRMRANWKKSLDWHGMAWRGVVDEYAYARRRRRSRRRLVNCYTIIIFSFFVFLLREFNDFSLHTVAASWRPAPATTYENSLVDIVHIFIPLRVLRSF